MNSSEQRDAVRKLQKMHDLVLIEYGLYNIAVNLASGGFNSGMCEATHFNPPSRFRFSKHAGSVEFRSLNLVYQPAHLEFVTLDIPIKVLLGRTVKEPNRFDVRLKQRSKNGGRRSKKLIFTKPDNCSMMLAS